MKNEYGIETVCGYVVIPNELFWKEYKEYFGTCVKTGLSNYYFNHHSKDPDQYPCIVETEWYEGRDNYRYWQHMFTYRSDLEPQLEALDIIDKELGNQVNFKLNVEDKELQDAFFQFLRHYEESIYDYFGRKDLFIDLIFDDDTLTINRSYDAD